ncbi:ATPase [Vibrio jasicida]|uniref:Uncharacterized AAA domain-containing protein ycf46 n=1 Tax=Vibrio jasicida TaxID=766224 RepID=A0AAU9QR64_9VIBR|nr:ATPase [Vibrio jasicida]CAH1599394.1 ATPase [Vibrio jasicida]
MADKNQVVNPFEPFKHKYIAAFEAPVRLTFPVTLIKSIETYRAEMSMRLVAEATNKKFHKMAFKDLPSIPTFKKIGDEATNERNKATNEKYAGAVVFDPYFFERMTVNKEVLPALKASINTLEMCGVTYVICGNDSLNQEYVYHADMPPLDFEEIIELVKLSEKSVDPELKLFTDAERRELASNALGLSYTQMKNVFVLSAYLKFKNKDYLPEVRKEKAHILREMGLEALEPVPIEEIGGLENLKQFLNVRKAGWDSELPVKGILMAGPPGSGKTATAKAAASILGTSLIRLDIGKFYSKYVGETEKAFLLALETIEQISPVTVLLDEVEKYLGHSEGQHEVTSKLLGAFLYWLQERKSKTFIVATANRVGLLPPELLRAGRFDRNFFVDLPTETERRVIFGIHLKKQGLSADDFDLNELLDTSVGYTGAEIEQAVIDAKYIACSLEREVSQSDLVTSIRDVTPTSETRREEIDAIRQLGNQGFYPASPTKTEPTTTGSRQINLN